MAQPNRSQKMPRAPRQVEKAHIASHDVLEHLKRESERGWATELIPAESIHILKPLLQLLPCTTKTPEADKDRLLNALKSVSTAAETFLGKKKGRAVSDMDAAKRDWLDAEGGSVSCEGIA